MKESALEAKISKKVKAYGGLYIKLTGMKGTPDRMVLLPDGKVYFIELKAPGKKPNTIQLKRIEQLQNLGFVANWADNYEGVMKIIGSV